MRALQEKSGLELKDFAAHGGGFPILLEGTGCIGTITVSGLPQREDHALALACFRSTSAWRVKTWRSMRMRHLEHKEQAMQETWRWFGPQEPISLDQIKQAGAMGIVSGLYHIFRGEPWPPEEVVRRKGEIESAVLSGPSSSPFPFTIPSSSAPDPTAVHRCMEGFSCRHRQGTRAGGLLQLHAACRLHPHEFEVAPAQHGYALRFDAVDFAACDLFLLEWPGAELNCAPERHRCVVRYDLQGPWSERFNRLLQSSPDQLAR